MLVNRKQHESGGLAIEPVHGRQVVEAGVPAQPVKEALLDIVAARRDRQEVRYVRDQDFRVLKNDSLGKRSARLFTELPKIENSPTGAVACSRVDGMVVLVRDLARNLIWIVSAYRFFCQPIRRHEMSLQALPDLSPKENRHGRE